MDASFMEQIETLRMRMGFPFHVSSAFRCPEHNDHVSSTGLNGPHTTGRAIDILVSGEDAYSLIRIALLHNFTGLGVAQKGLHASRFVHLDDLTDGTRPWVWTY